MLVVFSILVSSAKEDSTENEGEIAHDLLAVSGRDPSDPTVPSWKILSPESFIDATSRADETVKTNDIMSDLRMFGQMAKQACKLGLTPWRVSFWR